jgi:hypothetical protein
MRIAFTSDLHVDYQLEVVGLVADRTAELEPDALVIAGDLSPDLRLCEKTIKLLASSANKLLFVPGNHDLWPLSDGSQSSYRAKANSRQRYTEVLPELVERYGAVYLGLEPFVLGEVAFVGVTGWYDFSFRNRDLDSVIHEENYESGRYRTMQWMDCRHMDWPDGSSGQLRDVSLCNWMVDRLAAQTEKVAGVAERVVAVTHFLSHGGMVTHTGRPRADFVTAFLGSKRLGEVLDRCDDLARVISGHYHFPVEWTARRESHSFRCEVSPVGYPRERDRPLAEHVRQRVKLVEV